MGSGIPALHVRKNYWLLLLLLLASSVDPGPLDLGSALLQKKPSRKKGRGSVVVFVMMAPRRVIFVASSDFANVCTAISDGISAAPDCGWDARILCEAPHPFEYTSSTRTNVSTASSDELRALLEWASESDVLVIANEAMPLSPKSAYAVRGGRNCGFSDAVKRLRQSARHHVVWHPGSHMRAAYQQCNAVDRTMFDLQTVSPDLLRLALPGAKCVVGKPVQCVPESAMRKWRGLDERKPALRVGHAPTNTATKGTARIRKAMALVGAELPHVHYFEFGGPLHEGSAVSHAHATSQRATCHVYVDQHSDIGGIGMSSVEAMSLGCVAACTTHNVVGECWEDEGIPEAPVVRLPAPTGDEDRDVKALAKALVGVLSLPAAELARMAGLGVHWVSETLAPGVFARRYSARVLDPLC